MSVPASAPEGTQNPAASFVRDWLPVVAWTVFIFVGSTDAFGRLGVTFKPSVIEGVTVDINRVIRATEMLNRKVLEARHNEPAVAGPLQVSPAPAPAAAPRPAPTVARCLGCLAVLEADSQFCAECGRAVEMVEA